MMYILLLDIMFLVETAGFIRFRAAENSSDSSLLLVRPSAARTEL